MKCPNCERELEKDIGKYGEYLKCPSCHYIYDETKDLLKKHSKPIEYHSPLDKLPLQKRRVYLVKATFFEKVMVLLFGLTLTLSIILLLLNEEIYIYTLICTSLLLIYLLYAYIKMRRRLKSSREKQDDYIAFRINNHEHYQMYIENHLIIGHFNYLIYKIKLKIKGLPYRFKTDPIFSDLVMIKVRKEADLQRRIQIQMLKNEVENSYRLRNEAIEKANHKFYKDYGQNVKMSFSIKRVIINGEVYKFSSLIKASMKNHIYEIDDINYKHAINKKIKMCDSMKIICETDKRDVVIELVKKPIETTSKEYTALLNECYNITGGLRRAIREKSDEDVPSVLDDKDVIKETSNLIEKQKILLDVLKKEVIYKVPDIYK